MSKVIEISEIMTKTRKSYGMEYGGKPSGFSARITNPGKKNAMIEVYRIKDGAGASFNVGDTAEYDSYNLKYLGEIVSITEKSVSIRPKYERKVKRLDLDTFAWRNYDFDLDKIAEENHNTMMYI